MVENSIPTAHDRAFRQLFSRIELTRELLRSKLPEDIAAAIDWSKLEQADPSLTDEELAKREGDLLFRAELHGKPAFIYVLFEHQSTTNLWMPIRLLACMVRIWERAISNRGEPGGATVDARPVLPPIIPIVFAQCGDPWDQPTRLKEMISPNDGVLAGLIPDFEHFVIDAARAHERYAEERALSAIGALLDFLNAIRLGPRALLNVLEQQAPMLDDLEQQAGGRGVLVVLLRYASGTVEGLSSRELLETVRESKGKQVKEAAMTVEQELIGRGIERGIERGVERGLSMGDVAARRDMILSILRSRFPGAALEKVAGRLELIMEGKALGDLVPAALAAGSAEEFLEALPRASEG